MPLIKRNAITTDCNFDGMKLRVHVLTIHNLSAVFVSSTALALHVTNFVTLKATSAVEFTLERLGVVDMRSG